MAKHEDVMMLRTREDKKELAAQKEELHTRLVLLQSMSSNAAWNVFMQSMKDERDAVLQLMNRADNSTSMAREAGRLLAYERVLEWLPEEVKALSTELAGDS